MPRPGARVRRPVSSCPARLPTLAHRRIEEIAGAVDGVGAGYVAAVGVATGVWAEMRTADFENDAFEALFLESPR